MDSANPLLGVLLHAIGGLAAASFYIPYKRVRGWSWEAYWLAGGVFSWLIAPPIFAALLAPGALGAIAAAPRSAVLLTYLFGVLWGVGGLTFGLSMRYLGIALGYAVALGLCAAFGTLVPPLFAGELGALSAATSGRVILLGVAACLAGIALSGKAGMSKETELSAAEKQATVAEFDFRKGLLVAIFAGVMSACMSFAFQAGKPISDRAVELGAAGLWQNLPVLIVAFAGGLTTNAVWCLYLMRRNGSLGDYTRREADGVPIARGANLAFCALAGVTWYLQFFFYSMGTTKMGDYDFVSWALHMACIIIFSTLWGIWLHEWKGTGRTTRAWIAAGLLVLIGSLALNGLGAKLQVDEQRASAAGAPR